MITQQNIPATISRRTISCALDVALTAFPALLAYSMFDLRGTPPIGILWLWWGAYTLMLYLFAIIGGRGSLGDEISRIKLCTLKEGMILRRAAVSRNVLVSMFTFVAVYLSESGSPYVGAIVLVASLFPVPATVFEQKRWVSVVDRLARTTYILNNRATI